MVVKPCRVLTTLSDRSRHGGVVTAVLVRAATVLCVSWALLAFVGAATRLPLRLRPIVWAGTDITHARSVAEDLLWAAMDSRFGFPSGYFAVDDAASDTDLVVAREQMVEGTDLAGMFRTVVEGAVQWGVANRSFWGAAAGVGVGLLLAPVLLWAFVAEQLMRRVLRSRIDARLSSSGDGTAVVLVLRGPSAWFAGRRIREAFAAPRVPLRVTRKARAGSKEFGRAA